MSRNNYRVYHDPKRDKIVFIPSGMDQMFGNPSGNPNTPVLARYPGLIAQALLETPRGKDRYLARVAEIMKTVYRPDALVKRLDVLQARVQPVLASVDPKAVGLYPNYVNFLRRHIQQRPQQIEEQLKQLRK